jgi:hypothetical protein
MEFVAVRDNCQPNYPIQGSPTAREVIGRLLDPCYTLVETSISTEFGVKDAVLKSGGILEIQVDLAVQAVVCDGNSRANGGNIGVEDEREPGGDQLTQERQNLVSTDVVRSAEMNDPTVPCGQPVPPYAMELM